MDPPLIPPLDIPPEIADQVVPDTGGTDPESLAERLTLVEGNLTATNADLLGFKAQQEDFNTASLVTQNALQGQIDTKASEAALVITMDDVSILQTQMGTLTSHVDALDDRRYNRTLQPDPAYIAGDKFPVIPRDTQFIPGWTVGWPVNTSDYPGLTRTQVNTTSPLPRVPTAPSRTVFNLRTGSAAAGTDPPYVQQVRTLQAGATYTWYVLMCRRNSTTTDHPTVRLSATDHSAGGAVLAEETSSTFRALSSFEWRYYTLTFIVPASKVVRLRIENQGQNTVVTLLYIAEAYLQRTDALVPSEQPQVLDPLPDDLPETHF